MSALAPGIDDRQRLIDRARLLARAGNAWHVVEFAVAVGAGVAANSIALIAFGADSLIELEAGTVILWRFSARHADSEVAERRAQRLIAATYFLLTAYVAVEATRALVAGSHPDASWVGIGLALVTVPTMPLLAVAKRRAGQAVGSLATEREGSQNMICAYLAAALLVGLVANALLGWWWADPVAAIVIGAVALREGIASWRGTPRSCCSPVATAPACRDDCC